MQIEAAENRLNVRGGRLVRDAWNVLSGWPSIALNGENV